MRKVIFLVLFLSAVSPAAFADGKPMDKLTRGVTNVVTAPLEIPKQTVIYWIEGAKMTKHVSVWILSGVVKGHVNMVRRIGSGLWDVVSFPFQKPEDFEPLFKPDYVYEDWQFYR